MGLCVAAAHGDIEKTAAGDDGGGGVVAEALRVDELGGLLTVDTPDPFDLADGGKRCDLRLDLIAYGILVADDDDLARRKGIVDDAARFVGQRVLVGQDDRRIALDARKRRCCQRIGEVVVVSGGHDDHVFVSGNALVG